MSDYASCRVCGQSNPRNREFCALCGRREWFTRDEPARTGLSGLMETLEARVERRRDERSGRNEVVERRSA